MIKKLSRLISILVLAASSLAVAAQSGDGQFDRLSFTSTQQVDMPYRLHSPSYRLGTEPLPLIIYLHGAGGWGEDNNRQISGGNVHGTQLWLKAEVAAQHPAFVLAPQLPRPQRWGAPESDELSTYAAVLVELIDRLTSQMPIDENRIYLIGQSLGGMGVWDIVAKRPDLFAAGVPICGQGNTERIGNARDVALWAFHGARDTTVPVQGSREMVASFEAKGGNIRYTEYPDVGHTSWELAFADPDLAQWLFSKSKDRP